MTKKEVVKITETQLREIVKESVKQVLESRKKHLLIEMPLPRATYKERVDAGLPQAQPGVPRPRVDPHLHAVRQAG